MPRPRILDAERRAELCNLLASGLDLSEAARGVGCSLRTIRREADRDDAFRQQISRILLANRLDPLHHVQQAALTDWHAAKWILERFNPEQFARRDRASCSPQDLQTVVDRVIETVLQEIDKDEDRTRVYQSASDVARRGFNELFPAPRRNERRLMRGNMPLSDWEELNKWLGRPSAKLGAASSRPASLNSATYIPPVETPEFAVKTPEPTDKTTPVTDKTTPVTDKTWPPAWDPRVAPQPQNPAADGRAGNREDRKF